MRISLTLVLEEMLIRTMTKTMWRFCTHTNVSVIDLLISVNIFGKKKKMVFNYNPDEKMMRSLVTSTEI